MENKRGKFIVIEGIDGCGKTTQIEMLKEKLANYNYHFTREATDGPIGKLLREVYLTGNRKCDESVVNILYAADRIDHITNNVDGILKFLENGVNVISDRYYLSSMAYNSYMADYDEKVYELINRTINMNKINMDLLKPDLTIYIDLDPSTSIDRLSQRNEEISIYETTEKLTKIHKAYELSMDVLSKEFGEKFITIDGSLPKEEIHKLIDNYIYSLMNDHLFINK